MRITDLAGVRFGIILVLRREAYDGHGHIIWRVACDCGKEALFSGKRLRAGRTKSCGCMIIKRIHGNSPSSRIHSPEYNAWITMIHRCRNPRYGSYSRYGLRGIAVCDKWNNYAAFLSDMGPRPSSEYSLDRIDNNGNYEPSNCRWATRVQQCRNKRNNRVLSFDRRSQPLSAWAEEIGMKWSTLDRRLRNGVPLDIALTKPVRGSTVRAYD